jgi:deoxyribose-phosphate aldolase
MEQQDLIRKIIGEMDQKELVQRIVSEVMGKLAGQSQASKAGQGQAAAGSAAAPAGALSAAQLAKYIDHTMLRPEAPLEAFDKLCAEALQYGFFSVCVNSCRVAYVARKLRGTGVKVCSVIGFPLGAMSSRAKAFEGHGALEDGASELDMVLNIGALKSRDLKYVEEDIRAVRRASHGTTLLKVIIETALLSQEEKVLACELAKKAGADFVKTCTGFGGGEATPEDIALMRRTVGPAMGVKASGGVRSFEKAMLLIGAGATRLGAVAGVAIVTGAVGKSGY